MQPPDHRRPVLVHAGAEALKQTLDRCCPRPDIQAWGLWRSSRTGVIRTRAYVCGGPEASAGPMPPALGHILYVIRDRPSLRGHSEQYSFKSEAEPRGFQELMV